MGAAASAAGLFEFSLGRLFERLGGLTDEELLWEPVPGCWSVRRRDDGVWRPDLGADGTQWVPEPAPFSTIAWRLWHLGAHPGPSMGSLDLTSGRALVDRWFRRPRASDAVGAGDVIEAVALLHAAWDTVPARIRALGDDELAVVVGPVGGQYADATALDLLLHVADELIHHGAEVGVLRDLWRTRG